MFHHNPLIAFCIQINFLSATPPTENGMYIFPLYTHCYVAHTGNRYQLFCAAIYKQIHAKG